MKEILLCRPCAEKLKTEQKLKIGAPVPVKNTCECCGRRRFTYQCTKE